MIWWFFVYPSKFLHPIFQLVIQKFLPWFVSIECCERNESINFATHNYQRLMLNKSTTTTIKTIPWYWCENWKLVRVIRNGIRLIELPLQTKCRIDLILIWNKVLIMSHRCLKSVPRIVFKCLFDFFKSKYLHLTNTSASLAFLQHWYRSRVRTHKHTLVLVSLC